mgnify:CR=1 FL=1|jgi:hypothetical protein
MKIGINTYINNGGITHIIGCADVELSENEIISMFGKVVPFDDICKLISPDTNPSEEDSVFSFLSGVFIMKVFKIS